MVAKKRKSKRQTLQVKYKIIKRTQEHHRKLSKGQIVGGSHTRPKKPDNRIPNDWPYKKDLLQQIEAAKVKMEEIRIRNKEKRREVLVRQILPLLFFFFSVY